ncbi:MAG: TolB family protein, partial [Saprospiraceae bacterium]
LRYDKESHLKNLRQLTFGGDNAEAYFSFDNKYLTLQVTNEEWSTSCDQIFYMPVEGSNGARPQMISTGKGKTTCSFFMPGNQQIVYASTHLAADTCLSSPRVVDGKYVWAVHKEFDIFVADLNGNIVKQLTDSPGYDAEATVSPDGSKIVFTSTRSGDLELWTMNLDGSDKKQVTDELGYDGGAFFTPDSKGLVFRASRPKIPEEVKTYKDLLAKGLVQPVALELFVCNVDGSNLRQVTHLGGANWAPYMHPKGQKILFATNHHSESGRQFNIFSINVDGTGLEQITYDDVFDSFPMFSYDGKQIVFSSNRNNNGTHDTNVFIAGWVD